MNVKQSIAQQKRFGTLERNIKLKKEVDVSSQAEVARRLKISRQAVNIIYHRPSVAYESVSDDHRGYLSEPIGLLGRLIYRIQRLWSK